MTEKNDNNFHNERSLTNKTVRRTYIEKHRVTAAAQLKQNNISIYKTYDINKKLKLGINISYINKIAQIHDVKSCCQNILKI